MNYSNIPLIPMPKKVLPETETFERIKAPLFLSVPNEWQEQAKIFCEYAQRLFGIEFKFGDNGFHVQINKDLADESYVLDTKNDFIIKVGGVKGLNYAFASLLQLLSSDGMVVSAYIEDSPECSYRGVMVDLARKRHTLDEVLCYIDYCYLLKINHIQLHFTDDQGYMLPSKKFPKLPSEGHFSDEEIKLIREYALNRSVILIPELDLPGHSAVILKAYPELFANPNYKGETPDNAICIGKKGAFENVKELLCEVVEMFPESNWFHIGGDEVNYASWECSPDCLSYMDKNGINTQKELYTHVIKRLTDIVFELGKTPVVWEGFPEDGAETLSKDIIVMAWESYYQTADRLLANGFTIINCSWQPLYVVSGKGWDPQNILSWNIYNWQHWWPKSVAHLNPIHVQPTDHVLGAQLCAWEGNFEEEMIRVKQNLAALSERTWTIRRYCEDEQFNKKLDLVLPLLNKLQETKK